MSIDFRKAVLAGVAGTVAFDLAGFLLTGEFWDVPKLLASKLASDGPLFLGVGLHYVIGVTLAVLYAALAPSIPGNRWTRPLLYITAQTVLGVWLFMFPLVGAGPLGLKLGALVPVISLARHWVFALVLGAVYHAEQPAKQALVPAA